MGRSSGVDEKGSVALLTKATDDELGGAAVQVRVTQNNEAGHFLRLFTGRMVVREGGMGKDGSDSSDKDGVGLFQVKGADAETVRAVQVPEVTASLTSGDCFVLQTPGTIHIWNGTKCSAEERDIAATVGTAMAERLEAANGAAKWAIAACDEGSEPAAFWD
eukprot:4622884-Prymnesium_polylepis.1